MVKAEDRTGTPTPAGYTWNAAQIPIDPALQAQSQTPATPYAHYQYSHYPTAYGTAQYQQQYAAAQAQAQAQVQAQTSAQAQQQPATASTTTASGSGGTKADNADVDALNDALGSAGVDLRAEAESLQRSHDQSQAYRHYDDRTRKQPAKPSFDTRILGATMRTAAAQHKVAKIPEDAVAYLALALRARLQDLLAAMIAASAHRTDAQFDRPASLYPDGTPMWGLTVRSDVAKQLAALERVEREEEQRARKERKEREDMQAAHAAQLAAAAPGGADDDEGARPKKKKKEGPGGAAKNMSEEVQKKVMNATVRHALGMNTQKYSWMSAGGAPAATPKKAKTEGGAAAGGTPGTPAGGGSWAKPYISSTKPAQASQAAEDPRRAVTMRDAMFVIEKERGHGGGRGSARGWV